MARIRIQDANREINDGEEIHEVVKPLGICSAAKNGMSMVV